MTIQLYKILAPVIYGLYAMNGVAAQSLQPAVTASSNEDLAESKNFNDWLMRMHGASKRKAYIGTYVVSSGATLSSGKVWYLDQDHQQIERVETLTGAPRSIFRHNDLVVTFMPEHKVVRTEMRESLRFFPEWFNTAGHRIADFYKVKQEGVDRVAGVDADVVALLPKDTLRWGYRVWTAQKEGIVVKLQTLDTDGKVLEQSAFSELQLNAPVKKEQLLRMMGNVAGYRVERPILLKTTASAEGWSMKTPVAGFKLISCYKRPVSGMTTARNRESLQCIFSDGLASVSIFIASFDRLSHDKESSMSRGATKTLTKQIGDYWLTIMGEVPIKTLQLFVNGLEHKP